MFSPEYPNPDECKTMCKSADSLSKPIKTSVMQYHLNSEFSRNKLAELAETMAELLNFGEAALFNHKLYCVVLSLVGNISL